eukprot:scaffold68854_cov70-Phaeocystis_antarctica.AAC.4
MKLLRVVIRTVTRPPASRWKGIGCSSSQTSSRMMRQRRPFSLCAISSQTSSMLRCSSMPKIWLSSSRGLFASPSLFARCMSSSIAVRSLPNSSQKTPSRNALRTHGSRASQLAVVVLPRPAVPAMPVTGHAPTMPTTELGRPGGEAAPAGSGVKDEAVCGLVHECSVLWVNIQIELLHLTVKGRAARVRIQVPGFRLRADRGACRLEGLQRLGSIGDRLCEGRAKYPTRCIFKHGLPADHVGYECPLAQRTGQTCGAAAGEHDQLKLAGDHVRPDSVDERIDGHNLYRTTLTDKGEDRLRL